ncbi:MAG: helix-turn-helix transcriptional regulator [Methylococcales bacterium]|nr:helix-turn-helix transcriptional regulator [Methylococcales bacterium]
MAIHKKIRFIRQQKGWSQEQMANNLGMSINGYGSIERGDTDIGLSRLKKIASLFGVNLRQLVDLGEDSAFNTFHFFGSNNIGVNEGTQNNHNPVSSYCNCDFACNVPECNYLRQKIELEKQQIINEYKENELDCLKKINELTTEILHLKERQFSKEINTQQLLNEL